MRLGGQKPGSFTTFVDGSSDEALLCIVAGADGVSLIAFKLYDAAGRLVAESPEASAYPDGYFVIAADEEVLLDIPAEPCGSIRYRLRDRTGRLLTTSDGQRTHILGNLRMDGKGGTYGSPRSQLKLGPTGSELS